MHVLVLFHCLSVETTLNRSTEYSAMQSSCVQSILFTKKAYSLSKYATRQCTNIQKEKPWIVVIYRKENSTRRPWRCTNATEGLRFIRVRPPQHRLRPPRSCLRPLLQSLRNCVIIPEEEATCSTLNQVPSKLLPK